MKQCRHKPINRTNVQDSYNPHYPHMTRCRYCGERITPKKSWSYAVASVMIHVIIGASLGIMEIGIMRNSKLSAAVSCTILLLSSFMRDKVTFFVSWRYVPDYEIKNLLAPKQKIRIEASEDLGWKRFRRHKPISGVSVQKPYNPHYPHMTRCKYCGGRITPKKSWSYDTASLTVRVIMGMSTSAVIIGNMLGAKPIAAVSCVILIVSAFMLENISYFISWRYVPDCEIESFPVPERQVRLEALKDLDRKRFRG